MLIRAKSIFHVCALAILSVALGCEQKAPAPKADLVLWNGNIVTMSQKLPRAQAVAIAGNRILRVGTDTEIKPLIGEKTKVIDLEQKLVIPGLIDAHVHPFGAGRALTILDLKGLDKEQILGKVAQRAKETKKGEWIEAEGWDQGFWKEKEFPTRYELDAPQRRIIRCP